MSQATRQGLGGGSRAALNIVVGVGAFVAGSLAAPTMAGSGTVTPPQAVDCTGAFAGPDLSNPLQTGVGLASQSVSGSGAFTLDLTTPTQAGAGIANAVVVASGNFALTGLEATASGAGVAVQGAWNIGDTVEWGLEIAVTSAGTGTLSGQPDAVGTGAFLSGSLATPVMSGTASVDQTQQVAATGAFTLDLAAATSAASGASNPAGTLSGQGAFVTDDLAITSAGTGVSTPPQQVTSTGAFVAGDLAVTSSGSGVVTGILGIGAFSLDLSVSSVGTGIGGAPPAYDLGWEDDDVTWGGLQLTSKDFAPVSITADEFYILGQAADRQLDFFLERKALVYIPGRVVLGLRVQPDISGPEGSAVQISLGSHNVVDGAIDWEGPYDFVIGLDTFVDFAVSGKYLAVKFESEDISPWTLQSYTVEYEIIGKH